MPSRPRTLPDPPPNVPSFPDWARARPRSGPRPPGSHGAVAEIPDNAEFLAGAALAVLHPIARSEHPLGCLWRQRLALANAEAIVKLQGRTEDAAKLRDHLYLTRAGDDPGPAGRTLQAWRALGAKTGARPALWPEGLPALLQLANDEATQEAMETATGLASAQGNPIAAAADTAASTITLTQSRTLGFWLADAVLARRLNWPVPIPLLAANLKRGSLRFAAGPHAVPRAWRTACAEAYARGGAIAFDLYADLARKAERLLAEAPKQRGKDTHETVMALLSEDALAARAGTRASDRSGRRLFERLVELGAVRELTGRSTFRLYGL